MVQQGGLGRGLSSLIPHKNKTTNTKKQIKTSKNFKNNKKTVFKKTGSTGEANYFGSILKTNRRKVNAKKTDNKTENIDKKIKKNVPNISLKSIMEVGVEEIFPNPYQPRQNFNPEKLKELADSIAEHGIIQPLVVTHKADGGFELIAGERRLEASKLAGLKSVPVVTRSASEQNKAEWALIENIQRHNLNPIEEAEAYQTMKNEFGLTQDQIAKKIGKSRSAVANILRLLKLPEEIKEALISGKITEGHARTILALSDKDKQMNLFKSILKDGLNVRQVERITKGTKLSKNFRIRKEIDPDLLDIENKISEYLKTKVKIRGIRNNGKIIIDYYSEEELGGIVEKLNGE